MRLSLRCAALLAITSSLAGCGRSSSASAPASAPSATSPSETTASSAVASPSASATRAPLPPGRTPLPSLAEWNAQKSEVTVKGSSALRCETKKVREYLRVSCHDKDDAGGTPTAVVVERGGREALTFAAGGVTSLIVPYVEGTHLEATFSWTDRAYPLTLDWPKNTKMPAVLGAFAGAKSPLDGSASSDAQKLCECHEKVTGAKDCTELLGEANADCMRTFANDCAMLLGCARGEPGAAPRCLPGFVNSVPTGQCRKLCSSASDCAPGESCEDDGITHKACFAP